MNTLRNIALSLALTSATLLSAGAAHADDKAADRGTLTVRHNDHSASVRASQRGTVGLDPTAGTDHGKQVELEHRQRQRHSSMKTLLESTVDAAAKQESRRARRIRAKAKARERARKKHRIEPNPLSFLGE